MAKCLICESRKGKRKCAVSDGLICSQCCGSTRTETLCLGCSYYQKPTRKYNEVPAYGVSEMDGNLELESYSNSIEGALCAFDFENKEALNDSDAIRIIELLIDKYHFQDEQPDRDAQIAVRGFQFVDKCIVEDLEGVDREKIVKVLGILRFVAKRRTRNGREYLNVVHQYVGQRVGSGVRVLRQ